MRVPKLLFLTDSIREQAEAFVLKGISDALADILEHPPELHLKAFGEEALQPQAWVRFQLPEEKVIALQWRDKGLASWLRGADGRAIEIDPKQAYFEQRLEEAWLARMAAKIAGESHQKAMDTMQRQQVLAPQLEWPGWGWLATSIDFSGVGELLIVCSPAVFWSAVHATALESSPSAKNFVKRELAIQQSKICVQLKSAMVADVPLEELLQLKVGEAIVLKQKIDEPWPLYLDGKVIALAQLGATQGHMGVRITQANDEISS